MPVLVETITLDDARKAIDTAIEAARRLEVRATIIALDAGGDLVLATRMDGAWPGAFDLALAKAHAARAFAAPSGAFTRLVQPGAPLFGVTAVAAGKYMTLPGGVPIVHQLAVLGSIGASGGTPDQDEAIAWAAVRSVIAE
ncbi:ATP--cob(I)alamin adenosyltransferase [Novosphingobium sp. P6W]|uniref:ATP--cob(I)alamin adenosyltransferase n=1 Tax=Novosphingobium sp. P6W TaxID=1609758 RepID=UPI0005C2F3AD|nr:ATP--cob(I)alamin adenosyltransferase [Novosphingobium sp. P6W]AXB80415.1 ATP--cob(I)alamin adenosyltransferase [Novosphingobium sp. P6W]KIS31368.1 ATP:cob(I)alamin adenosyltransferase [Novosphingobium sp. P6W]